MSAFDHEGSLLILGTLARSQACVNRAGQTPGVARATLDPLLDPRTPLRIDVLTDRSTE